VSTGATSGEQTDEQHTLQTEITRLELALDQATKCVCCADSDKNTILNCGHYCLCSDCATRIQQCPLCRQPITERRRAFP
jgi:E3 ubiquitin-protein ligase RGLG